MDNFPIMQPVILSPTARILIGAGGLAVALAVAWGATLAARHAPPSGQGVNGADSDPMAASAICSANSGVAPPPAIRSAGGPANS
jgi:hypothetical protein